MTLKNDRVWFVTGANKGMGAAIAKEALDSGCNVEGEFESRRNLFH
jgi:NAD(P)-dependent dehydrogenase (short-subunit alcohol dehydrogenase family)